ncbi:MAG: stringent starvation protein B, partial [Methylophagaceae bacterium]
MTSQKPYLIRAVYEWLIDNGATPYLLVDTSFEGVIVPEAFINDSKIVLNIAPDAVQHYEVNNKNIYF